MAKVFNCLFNGGHSALPVVTSRLNFRAFRMRSTSSLQHYKSSNEARANQTGTMQTAPASSPPPSQPQLQVLIFVKHNLDITPPSEFSRRWRETHGPLVCSIGAIQRNIRRYEQLHVNHEIKPKLRAMGIDVPDNYDGVTLFEIDSIDKLREVGDSRLS
ncbi:hypothetical protein PM082_004017 [Marasmius tenuissimus]|nr:hypothetical protein PM082_004017 [Marasmius tenuissimus]